tara:strand:- start:43 stop:2457 length:2415 start_codon:yes stop_codon:yes gene_type:complete
MGKKDLSVFLRLNSKAFTSGLKRVESRLGRFGKQMTQVGSTLSSRISLPLLGLGAASVKLAMEFETSMTKIQTLVGLPGDEVDRLKGKVLDLAGQTATAPKELADGLFFLTSAGLRGANAMETLEAVAKGTAIGLGEQADLAKVAAAAQNAYGEEVVSASDALDLFGKMVQTGMFESSELANVLGSQLGLASNLGISMEELGAMISTYTRTTGSATDATTGLSGIMMSFAKITPKAETALKKATQSFKKGGMDADDLRKMLGEKGLQGTLLFLQQEFKKSGIPLSEFFSKSQSLKGVLGVLGEQTESYTDILNEMAEAEGFVNEGFEEVSQTAEFKFKKALTDLQVAGTKLGESLMPVATKIADAFSRMAGNFSSMSESSRAKLVKLGLALVALGPTLVVIGNLVKMFSFVVKAIRIAKTAVIAFGRAAMAMNPIGLIIAGIVGVIALMIKNWDKVKHVLVDVINYFIDLYNESQGFKIAVEGIKFGFKALWNYIQFWFKNVKAIFSGLGNAIVDLINFRSPMDSLRQIGTDIKNASKDFTEKTSADFETMLDNIQSKDKVELIDVEDIDKVTGKLNEGLDKLKNQFAGEGTFIGDLLGAGDDEEIDLGEVDATANADITFDETPTVGVDVEPKDPDAFLETMQELSDKTASAFNSMADAQEGEGGMAGMVNNIKKQAREIIKARIAEATASWAAQTFASVPFPANAILAATAGTVVGTLFNSIIPPFAMGGLVTGPTLAMVGEGSGTSMVNPEVIAPLDKLQGMIGGRGPSRLHGSISGNDILLSNDRSSFKQNRVGGSVTNF